MLYDTLSKTESKMKKPLKETIYRSAVCEIRSDLMSRYGILKGRRRTLMAKDRGALEDCIEIGNRVELRSRVSVSSAWRRIWSSLWSSELLFKAYDHAFEF